ncbi:hypothetical protein Tco_1464050 [Tanacetum coccineum]
MGRDTIQLDDAVSTISEEYLLEFTSEYGIPEDLHPELPGPEDTILDFSEGKVGAAKVGHFEITCRVLNIILTLNLFRVFYIPSYNLGWMSFSKRPGKNTPQCYTKPLDSLKNWNNRFFWVDEKVFPTVVAWRTGAPKDGMPPEDSYSALDVATLNTRRTPIQKQPELLLCLVGKSRRYFLGDDVYPTFLYDDDREMDLFNLISAPNPVKVKTETRPRATHEVPLLTATANRVIDMDTTRASGSSETPSTVEKSPLDFADEDLPPPRHATTVEVIPETGLEEEVTTMGPPVNKRRKQMRRKRANDEAKANAPPKVLRKDRVSSPAHSAYRGKSLAAMGLVAGSISSTPSAQGAPTAAKSVSDPDSLSYAKPQPYPEQDIAQSSRGTATEIPTEHVATTEVNVQLSAGSPESGKSTSIPSVVGSPGGIYQSGAIETEVHGLRNQTKNLETLLEVEADMKKAAEAKNAELTKELESLRVQFSDLQVNNNQLSQQVSNIQAQIMSEEKIKATFEEFKKYEDDRVEQRCAKMDARLDKLSMDFDEELYPHMLTTIAGRR